MSVCVYYSLSCVRLFATPWTVAHRAPLFIGFSRQEYWNGLSFPAPGDLPDPGVEPRSPALRADSSPAEPQGRVSMCGGVCVWVVRLCLTLCDPLDCSPPGFSVHGIPQVRTLEWVVISCSRVFSPPRDQTCISHVSWIGRQVLYHLINEGRLSIDSNLIQQNKNHSIHL